MSFVGGTTNDFVAFNSQKLLQRRHYQPELRAHWTRVGVSHLEVIN